MSEIETITVRGTLRVQRFDDGSFIVRSGETRSIPFAKEDVDKLTEAIHGQEIEDVVYTDRLPEVHPDGTDPSLVRAGAYAVAGPRATVAQLVEYAYGYLAIARHIEARDAAAKEKAAEEIAEAEKRHREWAEWLDGKVEYSYAGERWDTARALARAGIQVPEAAE